MSAAANKFQKSQADLASSEAAENLNFARPDWTSFRTVEGLQQKAGVVQGRLRRLVLKELADNALDTGTPVRVGALEGDGYFIEDQGPGLDPKAVARLYSINRPLISTKLLRLPTRGALGNGLRVVAGAVLASDGFLTAITRGRRLKLKPERDGSTSVIEIESERSPNRNPDRDRLRSGSAGRRQCSRLGQSRHPPGAGRSLYGQIVAVVVRRPAIP